MKTQSAIPIEDRPKLSISFSGGRSSAVMTKLLLDEHRYTHNIRVTFANTGEEHEDTLRFIRDCDRNWGFGVVWLEAVVHHGEKKGVTHKIVNYESASRNGEPFREFIKKYGIPNATTPQCTTRLKTDVMESYLKSQGFVRGKGINYDTAIGIRADEIDRISAKRKEQRLIYPLVKAGHTKESIKEYMSQFDWDLRIPEHYGNCVWCWKKTLRKHLTLMQDDESIFDFPEQMEEEFGCHKGDSAAGDGYGRRWFFRKHMSVQDIRDLAHKGDFVRFDDPSFSGWSDDDMDRGSGCEESCEVYADYV